MIYSGTNGGARVVVCSKVAQVCGARVGMPLAEAQALCQAAEPFLEADDPQQDLEQLRGVAGLCEKFTPLFGIEDSARPECLVLDVTGSVHLWGSCADLLQAVVEFFLHNGFLVRVAMAPTFGAAWAAAHFLATDEQHPVLAESAVSIARDDKTETQEADQLARVLSRLPVSALRLAPETVALLEELGVRSIGQLQALPRASLPSRLGMLPLRRLNQALGIELELWTRVEPRELLIATWMGEFPLAGDEELRLVCEDRLQSLMPQLERRRAGIRQLLCRVRVPGGQTQEWCLDFTAPVTSTRHVVNMLVLQWEREHPPCDIIAVHVEVTQSDGLQVRARNLFGEFIDGDDERELRELIDRLSNRLGRDAVLRAELLPEVRPEQSVAYHPFVSSNVPSGSRTASLVSPRQRPLRLWPQPQAIVVSQAGPEGAPLGFQWLRQEHRVIRSWGPERIETSWWQADLVRRDYFRVETQVGLQFWLFLNLPDFQWYLHGAFD